MNPIRLQRVLGHATLTMVSRYGALRGSRTCLGDGIATLRRSVQESPAGWIIPAWNRHLVPEPMGARSCRVVPS